MARILVVYDPPPPFGGVRVSAEQTVKLLRGFGGMDISDFRFNSYHGNHFRFIVEYIRRIFLADGVLFLIGGFMDISRPRALVMMGIARIFGKQIIYRGFGGGLEQEFSSAGVVKKTILKFTARRMRFLTFQTKTDTVFFQNTLKLGASRIVWLPNTRKSSSARSFRGYSAKRVCFFGKVSKAKGVHIIAEAKVGLPDEITIDVYGELVEGIEGEELQSLMANTGLRYRGSIPPEEIPAAISGYDCLLLPTTWRTEGYPGVVLEAFAAGVPVIVTRWNALPELVDDTCGILIQPHSPSELHDAILTLYHDVEGWNRMHEGALSRILDFDPEKWARKLHSWILETIEAKTAVESRAGQTTAKGN